MVIFLHFMDKNRHFLTPSPPPLVHVVIECPPVVLLTWLLQARRLVLYGARKVSDYDGVSNRTAIVVASAGTATASACVRGELRV